MADDASEMNFAAINAGADYIERLVNGLEGLKTALPVVRLVAQNKDAEAQSQARIDAKRQELQSVLGDIETAKNEAASIISNAQAQRADIIEKARADAADHAAKFRTDTESELAHTIKQLANAKAELASVTDKLDRAKSALA